MTEKIAKAKKGHVELSTGRKVIIKDMSIDDIDYCEDITEVVYSNTGDITSVRNLAKSRTAWIRRGLGGGDFDKFSFNAKGHVSDGSVMELSEVEKNELLPLIQNHQKLGE